MAMGTPASGPSASPRARLASTARAWDRAFSAATCRKECSRPSCASDARERFSGHVLGGALPLADLLRRRDGALGAHSTNSGNGEPVVLDARRSGEGLLVRKARRHGVFAQGHAVELYVRRRRDALRVERLELFDVSGDAREVARQAIGLLVREGERRELREVKHELAGEHAGSVLRHGARYYRAAGGGAADVEGRGAGGVGASYSGGGRVGRPWGAPPQLAPPSKTRSAGLKKAARKALKKAPEAKATIARKAADMPQPIA